jgi:transforming growth factor-beta-induced protein
MKKLFLIPMFALFAFGFTSCEDDETPELKSIVEIATTTDDFSILVQALVKADLVGALSGDGPFTVFAPTNAAFASLLDELGASSLDDIPVDLLTDVLLYHVLGAKVLSSSLTEGQVVTTLQGATFTVGLSGGAKITDQSARVANITAVDVMASNGVIHVLNKVILPIDIR